MFNNFIIIISNTARSVEYLKRLKLEKIHPNLIIHLDDRSNNNHYKFLIKKNYYFSEVKVKKFFETIISKKVASFILNNKNKIIIFSGYPGVIIKNSLLLKKRFFLHSHPGKLPQFKGSTTIYYSLLKYKKIFCSTLILNEKIDDGKVLFTKEYLPPKNIQNIDLKFDNEIRAKNLVYVIKNIKKIYKKKKYKHTENPYYVIHPLLRSIVFKKFK